MVECRQATSGGVALRHLTARTRGAAVQSLREHLRVFDPLGTTLADLGYAAKLRELVEGGENESVEGRSPTRARDGPIVSVFANTAGGWLLLGAGDRDAAQAAKVEDFAPRGRSRVRLLRPEPTP